MKLEPLYKVQLIEANRQHYYTIGDDETWYPGATTVLKVLDKPALVPWAAKCVSDNIKQALNEWVGINPFNKADIEKICEEGKNIYKKKASDAADIGTRVHRAVDCIIRGEEPTLTDDIKHGVQGFLDWRASNSIRIELGDTKLGSKLFGYGGSLDFIGFDPSGAAIIFDIKTTKVRKGMDHGIYDEAAYQLSSYRQAFKETYGIPVKAVYGLWLNKEKPEFKAVKIANPDICFEGFLACLKMTQIAKLEKFEDDTVLV